jgi:Lrp/AsnC family transcriptional regulator for asnA, asnC and gidA
LTEKHENSYILPRANDKSEQHSFMIGEAEQRVQFRNGVLPLDDTDLKILEALQEDARQTYTAIGKRLGIAHSTVYDRIRRMEQHGVIKKYTAVIDGEKAGMKSIIAIMTIYTDPKESERVAEELRKAPQVLEVYTSLSEELLIMAKVVAEDQESLHDFIANSVAPLSGVLRIRTSIVTKKFKDTGYSTSIDLKKVTFKRENDNRRREEKP